MFSDARSARQKSVLCSWRSVTGLCAIALCSTLTLNLYPSQLHAAEERYAHERAHEVEEKAEPLRHPSHRPSPLFAKRTTKHAWLEYVLSHRFTSLGALQARNQAPLAQLLGVPQATAGRILPRGRLYVAVSTDITNTFERAYGSDLWAVSFDLEIYRANFHFGVGLGKNIDLRVNLPMITFGGGVFDRAVSTFHLDLGFPNGGRETVQNDGFSYRVLRGRRALIDIAPQNFQLADISWALRFRVLKQDTGWKPDLVLRAVMELPTGRFSRGTGNSGTDIALGLAVGKTLSFVRAFAYVDGVYFSAPTALRPLVDTRFIAHFGGGLEIAVWPDVLSLIGQLEYQTLPYRKTGTRQLNRDIFEILGGIRGRHLDGLLFWSLSLREDLIYDSTADFTISMRIGSEIQL